jgi:hypothetical protein
MSAPEITDRIAAIEAAPDAEESLRERVARAICEADKDDWVDLSDFGQGCYLDLADAAIAVITTPVTP